MPFTLSHPAAAAPFWPLVRRNWLPLSALAIGMLSPDFEYLWRLRTEWRVSHTPLGILDFCLPTGLAALGLWVHLVRTPTRDLLALPKDVRDTSPRWWLVSAAAILLGAATHIVWDGFTHGFDWAVRLVPGLQHTVRLGSLSIPVFNLVQHTSTVIGGLIVLGWLVHEIRGGEPRALLAPWRITACGALVTVAGLVAMWNALRGRSVIGYWSGQVLLSRAGVGGLLGLGVGLVAYAIAYRVIRAAPARDSA
ncbi:MAG TPA: DUF4184 family protein [Gemmatimonadales bacterium]|nr:DUF4184 family protein [Gemmatimonadales bacterium]